MKVIEPDFDRTIDLPGVGPTPRPVDVDQSATGFSDLLSLRIYDFAADSVIEGEAEEDEVLVVLLGGAATVAVSGLHEAEFTLQADGDWAIYLPPRHRYRLSPIAQATIAYARARPSAALAPRAFAPMGGLLSVEEHAERLRLRLLVLEGETDASAGLDSGLERLAHLTGPVRVTGGLAHELPPAHTLALHPGETAHVEGEGELLAVAALRPPG
jgi:hypothetical protein